MDGPFGIWVLAFENVHRSQKPENHAHNCELARADEAILGLGSGLVHARMESPTFGDPLRDVTLRVVFAYRRGPLTPTRDGRGKNRKLLRTLSTIQLEEEVIRLPKHHQDGGPGVGFM